MELALRAERLDVLVLAGECLEARARPLRPSAGLSVDSWTDVAPDARVRRNDCWEGAQPILAPYEPALRGLPGQGAGLVSGEPSPMSPEEARIRLFRALTDTFSALAGPDNASSSRKISRLLLVLDDLHWQMS
jgi:hypothetical protein